MPRTRPVRIPHGMRTVTVGGATLGGSGKTRVAIAIAKDLASRGERVVLVGHAYRATPRIARFVSPNDRLADVGDEAIVCARALDGMPNARVVVAPSRQAAVDHAVGHATVLVFDGPLQLRPVRASLSVIAVDAGDPRPHPSLLAHADVVVPVDPRPTDADVRFLRGKKLGLFTAIARPRRLVDALRRAGLLPAQVVETADHGPVSASARRILATAEVDLWVATPKCAVHLECEQLSARLRVLTCIDPPCAGGLNFGSVHSAFPAPFRDDKT